MKKLVFCAIVFLLRVTLLFSQGSSVIDLWPNKVPGEKKAKGKAVVTDNKSRGVTRLTNITNPILEVFNPDKEKSNGKAIIVCPGGAYAILAIDIEGYEIASWLTKFGYTTYVLQYRVPDNPDGALQDVQRAIRMVRSKAHKKVGVMGFSAGGSLSARASTRFNELTYPKQDKTDELSCRPDFTALIYPAYLDKGENRSLTPELTISEQTPPFFIFGTADDKYGNSSLVMTSALRDNEIPVELHFLPKGGHGYGLRGGNVAAETWPGLLQQWLQTLEF